MGKIIITADSVADLWPEAAAHYGVHIISLHLNIGDADCLAYPEIHKETLYEHFERTGELPRTAAVSPGEYEEFFRSFTQAGDEVIHISMSAALSCCHQNALLAAETVENVSVVDSQNISVGTGMLALHAVRMADEGLARDEIVSRLEELRTRVTGGFIIDQLTYLYKGGRCSALSCMGANLLKLRPEIVVREGTMSVRKKYRGSYEKCLFAYIDDMFADLTGVDPAYLTVGHTLSDDDPLLAKAVDYMKAKGYFREIVVQEAGAAVACHCGPNTFGMFYVTPAPAK